MPLKAQDVLVLLKWALNPRERWTVRAMGSALGISGSEAAAAVKRSLQARLMVRLDDVATAVQPVRESLLEFLIHGLKYVYPAERGSVTRGVPTAYAAPVLKQHFAPSDALPPVWPDPKGSVRGEAFKPLYKAAVTAAANDPALYSALALIDAIRGGNARERELAAKLLTESIMRAGE